ncbi:hypothetical protein [Streptomyces candidus]|uniref:PIN domain-containing protein n=1 Tax=Streptomyces candidus TaxID=67283 RepID=A0A7X0HDS4_9ACTN|nr:hypothetical protein [Streptomyces candidus]MBB6435756.1 hypothetical protein [Streptomyces candidus]GHH46241.1 hypothetical protein GCM10018773_36910 [Streptomyces candidus]
MQRIVLDTCVLYPNYLRDTLLGLLDRLAKGGAEQFAAEVRRRI